MSWVESPSYSLRRWTVLRELRDLVPGRLLEIGCGAGDLFAHLLERGYGGVAVEPADDARHEATARLAPWDERARVVDDLDEIEERFDLVVACEVLEHVEDDEAAFRAWAARLRPGGRLLLTVPAHPHRFGASDEWAGHYRRYRRRDLERLAAAAGLEVERLICFAFPLGNLIEPVRNRVNHRRLARERLSRAERTARSGVERPLERHLRAVLPPALWRPFYWLQVPFFATDLGTGLLLRARRPEEVG